MELKKTARAIVQALGGSENIVNLTHCMTRLRFKLQDESKVELHRLEAIEGVLGTACSGGEQQVIIGTNVDQVYREILNNYWKDTSAGSGKKDGILEVISQALSPIIPVIMGAAFISIILALLIQFGLITTEFSTYQVLNGISSAVYHFFPVLIALTLSARLKVNQVISVASACFLFYPDFIALIGGETPATLFGISIMNVTYAKGIIPVFLMVYAQKYLEMIIFKYTPKAIKTMVGSGLVMILTVSLTILILGPIGAVMTEWINAAYYFIVDKLGWFAIPIIAFINPIMLGTGLGTAAFPVMLAGYLATGYEGLVLIAALAGNAAQAGSGFAISVKSKNRELKAVASETAVAALMGVTEPIIFSVHYKLKRTLITVMCASFVAAFLPALTSVKCYALATGVLSLPAYLTGGVSNFVFAILTILLGMALGFAATWVVGFKDPTEAEFNTVGATHSTKKTELKSPARELGSPVGGKVVPLDSLPDKAFTELGAGIAVVPSDGKVCAPCNGTVTVLGDTMHAVAVTGKDGMQILIHIGIDTVKLGGKYFKAAVHPGDSVKKGELLVEFDREAIAAEGYDTTVAVLVTNPQDYLDVFPTSGSKVNRGEKLLTVL